MLESPNPKAAPAAAEADQGRSTAKSDPAPQNAARPTIWPTKGGCQSPIAASYPLTTRQMPAGVDAGLPGEAASPPARDAGAHAAKDRAFELESPRSQTTSPREQNGPAIAAGAGIAAAAASRSTAGRVDAVPHVVERNENFWTISRLYYSSGRYYRALWKANADTHPDIRKLKINDVINIPPVEDLDPAYIDPPRGRAPAHLTGAVRSPGRGKSGDDAADLAESSVSSSVANRDEPFSTARASRGTVDGVPVRRSSRTDPDLDLPAADAVSRRSPAPDRTGRRVDRPLGDDDATDERPPPDRSPPAGMQPPPHGRLTRSASSTPCGPSPATCWATLIAPARSLTSTAT